MRPVSPSSCVYRRFFVCFFDGKWRLCVPLLRHRSETERLGLLVFLCDGFARESMAANERSASDAQ